MGTLKNSVTREYPLGFVKKLDNSVLLLTSYYPAVKLEFHRYSD